VGTKTVTMYVSDLDQSEIPAGQAYQLSIRDPAARYLRAELPRPEVGGRGQDAEEAWPQARVHDRGRHSAQAPPAPDQRTARHRLTQATQSDRLGALTAGPTAKLSAWSRWSSGDVETGRSGIERSSCLAISTPPLQFRRRRLMWFGGGWEYMDANLVVESAAV
jgi:hypothetical protein